MKRYSKDFGKKEKVLNYANQTYQLSRPNKVGPVMALIRECQPESFQEWEQWYFKNAYTKAKTPIKITNNAHPMVTKRSCILWVSSFCTCGT